MPCRILYRSRQRGYLELDLLLGKWAEENIAHLDQNRLKDLVDLLEEVRTSLVYVVTEIITLLSPVAPFGSSFLYPWSIWLISNQVSERCHHFHSPPSETWWKLMDCQWPLWLFIILHVGFRIKYDVYLVNETKSCIHDWSASFIIVFEACFPLHCAHPPCWGVSGESRFVELAYWTSRSASWIGYQHCKYLMYVVLPCISWEFDAWSRQAFIQSSNSWELDISSRHMVSIKTSFKCCNPGKKFKLSSWKFMYKVDLSEQACRRLLSLSSLSLHTVYDILVSHTLFAKWVN